MQRKDMTIGTIYRKGGSSAPHRLLSLEPGWFVKQSTGEFVKDDSGKGPSKNRDLQFEVQGLDGVWRNGTAAPHEIWDWTDANERTWTRLRDEWQVTYQAEQDWTKRLVVAGWPDGQFTVDIDTNIELVEGVDPDRYNLRYGKDCAEAFHAGDGKHVGRLRKVEVKAEGVYEMLRSQEGDNR